MIFGMVANPRGCASQCRYARNSSLDEKLGSNRGAIHGVEGFGLSLFSKPRMALEQTRAAVPAKNGIVIASGAYLLGFCEAAHRFLEERGEGVGRTPHAHLC